MRGEDRAVLWFRFRDDRRRSWTVWLTRPDLEDGWLGKEDVSVAEQDYGRTFAWTRQVLVNANKPVRDWAVTAMHELNHAALADTGFFKAETFIDVHACRILPVLRSLGFRFPKPPRLPWRRRR